MTAAGRGSAPLDPEARPPAAGVSRPAGRGGGRSATAPRAGAAPRAQHAPPPGGPRVHGRPPNRGEGLQAAAKQARATATPAGTSYEQQWPRGAGSHGHGSTTARDIESAINAFRYEVRDAARRVSADDGARQEVIDILSDAARKIRNVLLRP